MWVGAELQEISPGLHAKQTHCLALGPGKIAVTSTFPGSEIVPLQPHRNPRKVSAVQTSAALQQKYPVNLAEPGAGEKVASSLCFLALGLQEAMKEFPRVLEAVMCTAVMCTAGDLILGLRTPVCLVWSNEG